MSSDVLKIQVLSTYPETGLDYVQGAPGTQQLRIHLRLIHSPPGRNQSSGYPHTWPQIVIAPTRPKHDRVGYCQEGGGRGQWQFHFQNHCYKAEAILAVPIHLIPCSDQNQIIQRSHTQCEIYGLI